MLQLDTHKNHANQVAVKSSACLHRSENRLHIHIRVSILTGRRGTPERTNDASADFYEHLMHDGKFTPKKQPQQPAQVNSPCGTENHLRCSQS